MIRVNAVLAAKRSTVFIFESPLSVVLLTTESENHIREMKLCLKMRLWAESFGILDYETRVQGTGRSETKRRRHCWVGKSEGKTLLARTTTSGQSMLRSQPLRGRRKPPFCGSR